MAEETFGENQLSPALENAASDLNSLPLGGELNFLSVLSNHQLLVLSDQLIDQGVLAEYFTAEYGV